MAKNFTMNGGPLNSNGPVRMKKRTTLMQSIMGVFIGLLLVAGSPFAMWNAASQHKAKDFKSATQVEETSSESGYITLQGTPSLLENAQECADKGSTSKECIYQKKSEQQLITTKELMCQDSITETDTLRVIGKNGVECDDETGECTQCWDVEKDSWEEQSSKKIANKVKVGNYTINTTSAAVFISTTSFTEQTPPPEDFKINSKTEDDLNTYVYEDEFGLEYELTNGDAQANLEQARNEYTRTHRNVYTTFNIPNELRVAGLSDGQNIGVSPEKVFVLSSKNYEGTYSELVSMDKSARLMLWIVAAVLLFIGFSLILGPLEWAGRMFGKLPVVGPFLRSGSRGMIMVISIGLTILAWILEWFAIVIMKNIWIILGVVIAVAALTIYLVKKDDK